jgi:1,4-alpha-glucan branching enzyme
MGTELAPWKEWNHDESLPWHLAGEPGHGSFQYFMQELGKMYHELSPLWRRDYQPEGFSWIDVADRESSVLSFVRRDGPDHAIVVMNLTPVPRPDYRIGAPSNCTYRLRLSTDDAAFGGSGFPVRAETPAEPSPFHGYPQSIRLDLPPLGVLVMVPERR